MAKKLTSPISPTVEGIRKEIKAVKVDKGKLVFLSNGGATYDGATIAMRQGSLPLVSLVKTQDNLVQTARFYEGYCKPRGLTLAQGFVALANEVCALEIKVGAKGRKSASEVKREDSGWTA